MVSSLGDLDLGEKTQPRHHKDSCFWGGLRRDEETGTWRHQGYGDKKTSLVSSRRGVSALRERTGGSSSGRERLRRRWAGEGVPVAGQECKRRGQPCRDGFPGASGALARSVAAAEGCMCLLDAGLSGED